MTQNSILGNDLLPEVGYPKLFHAFGYKPDEILYLRMFKDPKAERTDPVTGDKVPGVKRYSTPARFEKSISGLRQLNQQHYGVFFVVNGGGDGDQEVKSSGVPARAQFAEIDPPNDDLERVKAGEITMEELLEEQLAIIEAFPLEPSIIIRTWKSLHVYWLLIDGDIKRFRALQRRLVRLFKSDSSIQNESRVMRIPGFLHQKHPDNPVEVKLIKFDPDLKYTQEQMDSALDTAGVPGAAKEAAPKTADREPGELVLYGGRDKYLARQARKIMSRVGDIQKDPAIVEMLLADFYENCEQLQEDDAAEIRANCEDKIRRARIWFQEREKDPDYWKYNVRAWEAEHPGQKFNSDVTGWDAAEDAGERARGAGKRFDAVPDPFAGVPEPPTDEGSPENLEDIFGQAAIVDVIADYGAVIPEKNWTVRGIVTAGECAIISGASKSGKSYLMTELAICLASGRAWLDTFPCRRTPVLYLNGENEINDARERFQMVMGGLNVRPESCERIQMVCADGMMKSIQSLQQVLISEIWHGNYGAVILDPLYCFYQGSEIDEADAKAFVSAIKGICRETGAALFCVHHHSKGAGFYKNASSRASGSGMLQRAFSTLLDVSEVDADNLPEGVRGFEFSGQPRQAAGFKKNLLFDFPVWRYDAQGLLPDNAKNKARTAAARANNPNMVKSEDIKRVLPEVINRAFKRAGKKDEDGSYITLGDVVDEFREHLAVSVKVSETTIRRRLQDGVAGFRKDETEGKKRFIRRVNLADEKTQ